MAPSQVPMLPSARSPVSPGRLPASHESTPRSGCSIDCPVFPLVITPNYSSKYMLSSQRCSANWTPVPAPAAPLPGADRLVFNLMSRRLRLDAELVRRGLARSRDQAAELIASGRVAVGGQTAAKPASQVSVDAAIPVQQVSEEHGDVSRGGHKLARAR